MNFKTKNYEVCDNRVVISKQAVADGLSINQIMKETGASITITNTEQDMYELGGRKVACFIYEASVTVLSKEEIAAIKAAEEKVRKDKEEADKKEAEALKLKAVDNVSKFPPPLGADTLKV